MEPVIETPLRIDKVIVSVGVNPDKNINFGSKAYIGRAYLFPNRIEVRKRKKIIWEAALSDLQHVFLYKNTSYGYPLLYFTLNGKSTRIEFTNYREMITYTLQYYISNWHLIILTFIPGFLLTHPNQIDDLFIVSIAAIIITYILGLFNAKFKGKNKKPKPTPTVQIWQTLLKKQGVKFDYTRGF